MANRSYASVVSGDSDSDTNLREAALSPASWIRDFQEEDDETALKKAIEQSLLDAKKRSEVSFVCFDSHTCLIGALL